MSSEIKRPPGEEYVKEAIYSPKRRKFSTVWIVPIVALIIGLLLVYKSYKDKGATIQILFKSAEGITAGKSVVKYKDIEVGKVTDVRFSKDLNRVIVTASLTKEMEPYLREETKFWIVHARLSADSVEGLDTLLSGAYIGMEPSKKGSRLREFKGLDEPPAIIDSSKGKRFVLESSSKGSLQVGSPIYYKKLKAGKVIATHLSKDYRKVLIDIYIKKPFSDLVTDTTRFWDASGIDASITPDGVEIRTASIASIISGGISFDNFDIFKEGKPVKEMHHFILFKNIKMAKKITYTQELFFWVYFQESIKGLKEGSPVEFRGVKVGEVVKFFLIGDAKTAEFHIPILIKIEPERFMITGRKRGLAKGLDEEIFKKLIAKGLRAQLQSSNLLTGSLAINLDFHSEAKKVTLRKENGLYVFPSVPGTMESLKSDLQKTLDKISSIPFDDIGKKIDRLLSKLDKQTIPQLNSGIDRFNTKLLPSFTKLIDSTNIAVKEFNKNYLESNAQIQHKVIQLLDEIRRTSQSIKSLTDYLNRHPEALIRGR